MTAFDEYVEMPESLDDWFYELLKPFCGRLTIACVDAAWSGVISVLNTHVQREAIATTREAVLEFRRSLDANDA